MHLTFVDGQTKTFDIENMRCEDIFREIDSENGRLDTEAMFRGKAW